MHIAKRLSSKIVEVDPFQERIDQTNIDIFRIFREKSLKRIYALKTSSYDPEK